MNARCLAGSKELPDCSSRSRAASMPQRTAHSLPVHPAGRLVLIADPSMLEARADVPPSPVTLITRVYLNDSLGLLALQDLWETWEVWFAQIAETHTSLGALTFFPKLALGPIVEHFMMIGG